MNMDNLKLTVAAIGLFAYLLYLGIGAWQLFDRRIAAEIEAAAVRR